MRHSPDPMALFQRRRPQQQPSIARDHRPLHTSTTTSNDPYENEKGVLFSDAEAAEDPHEDIVTESAERRSTRHLREASLGDGQLKCGQLERRP